MRRPSIHDSGVLAVLASNAVAPLGIFFLGWSTTVLFGVFIAEIAVVLFWSMVKMPFAAKRPNNALGERGLLGPLQTKRGSTSLPGPLPPVYLRNVPSVVIAASLLAPLELAVALGVFGLADPTITDETGGRILLGGLSVFIGHGIETTAHYFGNGEYRNHSPRSLLLLPFKQLFAVAILLFAAIPFEESPGSDAFVAVVVAGKFLYDLRTLQLEHDDDKRGIFYRLYGSEETEIHPVPVSEPTGEPVHCDRTNRWIAVADALYRGVRYTFTSVVLLFYAIAAALALFGGDLVAVLIPITVAGVFAGAKAVSRYLRYGTVEYRCYGDVLVVYDTLLDEPQARLERGAVTDLTITTDAVDRQFGTETLVFETDEDDSPDVQLTVPDPAEINGDDANENHPLTYPHVENPEAVADAFGVAWRLTSESDERR
ncbi:hypothetical protein GL213_01560 [Halogeometricum borinquense]|uniref:Uncharacterized protein n=1 Tax=Halogeometricum borinquense TaxID=60847 RepID=A0A6C0ULZ8_9EURY|nr:DUF6498-containing protein [Halogeometricum borinquense]QIB76220.1 hypothetical protein G3I44_19310 [Halogeometricum borinquense]QIQ75342.1 hypothetical protein GL213_01560 [Halogeometricum borinquense]